MGFYRIFYIIKSCIKSVLYRLPKKWLIMIIFALVMTFGLTQVKGFSFTDNTHIIQNYNANNLTFYEGIMLKQPLVTDIQFNDQQGYDLSVRYVALPLYSMPLACGTNNYGTGQWDTKPDLTYIINENTSGDKYSDTFIKEYVRSARAPFNGHATNPCDFIMNYRVRVVRGSTASNLYYSYNASYQNTDTYTDYSSRYETNTTNYAPLVFALRNNNNSFYIRSMLFQDESHALYPASIGDSGGLYDVVTGTFYYLYGSSNFTTYNSVSQPDNPYTINPFISTSSADIINYTFENLVINGGTEIPSPNFAGAFLEITYNGITNSMNINGYYSNNNGVGIFTIPRNSLIQDSSIVSGRSVKFRLLSVLNASSGFDYVWYDLGTYTFNLTSTEQQDVNNDQVIAGLDNVNDSINNMNNNISNVVTQQEETNNFLQDTNVSSSTADIDVPDVEGQAVISQVDGSFTSFFSDFVGFLSGSSNYSVSLLIPDMRNGNVLSTITIPSNYISSKLSSIPLFIPNTSLLDLIHVTWYLLFGFWFLYLGTNFITIIYSGDIIKDKGLSKLTSTYIGVSKNML